MFFLRLCSRVEKDGLVYPDSVSSIFRITDDIYSAAIGMTGDARYQVKHTSGQRRHYLLQTFFDVEGSDV